MAVHRVITPETAEWVQHVLGGPADLDPCSNAAVPYVARRTFEGTDVDGLTEDWAEGCKTVWVFPPSRAESVGRPHTLSRWVQKCADTADEGVTILALLPAETHVGWFHTSVIRAAAFTLVRDAHTVAGVGGKVRGDRGQITVLWTRDPQTLQRYSDSEETRGIVVAL